MRSPYNDRIMCLYLQAASRAVFCDDADIGRVDAGADKTGQVLILHISHLDNKRALLFIIYSISVQTFISKTLHLLLVLNEPTVPFKKLRVGKKSFWFGAQEISYHYQ